MNLMAEMGGCDWRPYPTVTPLKGSLLHADSQTIFRLGEGSSVSGSIWAAPSSARMCQIGRNGQGNESLLGQP